MSLDVYLTVDKPIPRPPSSGIFIRENGAIREISREEWNERYPGREPVTMVDRTTETNEVYSANITHNLGKMADEAGIYEPLWKPDEVGLTKAEQLIEPLRAGLQKLKQDPERYKEFNPENGWGSYDGLVAFVENYIAACEEYPQATVSVWA